MSPPRSSSSAPSPRSPRRPTRASLSTATIRPIRRSPATSPDPARQRRCGGETPPHFLLRVLVCMSDRETVCVCRGDVVSCALGDGVTLLDMQSEKYFSLNETGAVVWNQAKSGATLAQLCDAIAQTYCVDGQAA